MFKRIISITSILFFVFLISCSKHDFSKTFSFVPEKVQPGSQFEILFNPANTVLEKAESITMVAYLYNVNAQETKEILMQKKDGGWLAPIFTNPTTKGIIVKFTDGSNEEDNNNDGYFVALCDNLGKSFPETQAGKAVAYARWGVSAGLNRDREKAYEIFKTVFETNPEIKLPYLDTYFYTIERTNPSLLEEAIKKELDEIETSGDLTAEKLSLLSTYYAKISNTEKSELYSAQLLENYPDSDEAQKILVDKITSTIEVEAKLAKLKDFTEKFPKSIYITELYDNVCFSLIEEGKITEVGNLLKTYPDLSSQYLFYYALRAMSGKENFADLELEVASLGQERSIREIEAPTSPKPEDATVKEWMDEIKYYAALNFYKYGEILCNRNQPQIALTHLKSAVDFTIDYSSRDDINNQYITCLIAVGEKTEATKTIEEFISKGKSDEIMKETLKQLYTDKKGSEEGFAEYVSVFENKAHGELIEKLKKEIISKPSVDFELLDMAGKKVKLSDYKGKSVILDFWATWCGPCRKSFPGMKIALKKYKNNNNVKFLFINTWENVDDKLKNASDFMKKNDYPFHVLMDTENVVVGLYKVSGIPTKFVIDKEQNIRFISIGVEGSAEYIADEITLMLDMIK